MFRPMRLGPCSREAYAQPTKFCRLVLNLVLLSVGLEAIGDRLHECIVLPLWIFSSNFHLIAFVLWGVRNHVLCVCLYFVCTHYSASVLILWAVLIWNMSQLLALKFTVSSPDLTNPSFDYAALVTSSVCVCNDLRIESILELTLVKLWKDPVLADYCLPQDISV